MGRTWAGGVAGVYVDVLLVAHGEAEPLQGLPRAWWPLSDMGRAAAITLAQGRIWRRIGEIYCSGELAAFETAHLIAPRVGANVTAMEALWLDSHTEGDGSGTARSEVDADVEAFERVQAVVAHVRTWTNGPIAVVLHPHLFGLFYVRWVHAAGGDPTTLRRHPMMLGTDAASGLFWGPSAP